MSNDDRCKILISSLQDTLHGIETKSYGHSRRGMNFTAIATLLFSAANDYLIGVIFWCDLQIDRGHATKTDITDVPDVIDRDQENEIIGTGVENGIATGNVKKKGKYMATWRHDFCNYLRELLLLYLRINDGNYALNRFAK